MLPFASGITGIYADVGNLMLLRIRSLRSFQEVHFTTQNQTVINTIKNGFSPILEDYLGDYIPGFSNAFLEMQSHPVPADGEEREFNITSNTKMKFCWIPAGGATLGSLENEEGRWNNETKSEFETNGFWMGKYPVTQAQWKRVMGDNPSYFSGDNLPVEQVSWYDCRDFAEKCDVLKLNLQIPHKSQWEYACRGGRGNKQPFYWGNTLNGDKANCIGTFPYGTNKKGAYLAKTTEVGSYEKVAPHPWGLCDMIGNVYEWCESVYLKDSLHKHYRGGAWSSPSSSCRSANYNSALPHKRGNDLGFRLIIC